MKKYAGKIILTFSVLFLAGAAFYWKTMFFSREAQAAAPVLFSYIDGKNGEQGIIHNEMKTLLERLRMDDIFRDDAMELTELVVEDMDGNGQKDMLAVFSPRGEKDAYGSGCIWISMNGDEPYRVAEPDCFYDGRFDFFAEDIDNDGNMEIVLSMEGSGCGGAGDFYKMVLKYRRDGAEAGFERMELPSDLWDGFNDQGIVVSVYQEPERNLYSAYCSYFKEIIYFEAQNASEPEEEPVWVGGNERGFFELCPVKYEGKNALQASEYLYGEGGSAHEVATAQFLILWDENGNAYVEKWWLEDSNGYAIM